MPKQGKFVGEGFISVRTVRKGGSRRFHFVVGQRVSRKATERNKIKRRLRAAILKLGIRPESDTEMFVMPTAEIISKNFEEIMEEIERIFKK